jgi:hypothetical protein
MSLKSSLKIILLGTAILVSSIASAAIIKVEDVELKTLELSSGTFKSFYAFTEHAGNLITWSANTGLEEANTIVTFFAKVNNDIAMFMIASGPDGSAGSLDFDVTASQGSILFVDDPDNDPVNGSNVSMSYVAGKTDGIIYGKFPVGQWNIDVLFNSTSGLDSMRFLTFDQQGQASVALTKDSIQDFSVTSMNITSPSVVMLFLSMLGFILTRKK